jgi:NIMA (never in mitosis gene a)-related kinase
MSIDSMNDQEKKEAILEAKILERLNHPNIINFREVFFTTKPKYALNIVMDFADGKLINYVGGDLQSRIKAQKGKAFPESQIIDWFTQICLAIKHIHDKKILHRDLKSQNIFLTKNGLVKLGDFGIAKCLNYTLEKVQTIVGTPYYLSPEIVHNKPYSFESDIWSLGVLLYEMMALKMPFDATSMPMLSLKIIRGNYNSPPSFYSKDLKTLVAMLLNVEGKKRPRINDILSKYYIYI